MDTKTYNKLTDRELRGRKVRSLVELHNGWCRIPQGTTFTITRKMGGLHLETEPCVTCGVRVRISYVPPRDVELMGADSFLPASVGRRWCGGVVGDLEG